MGEMVGFPSDGATIGGYLAPAKEGAGLGVVVIPESGGLSDHVLEVCDRFATEGFTAMALDVDLEGAARDLSGAVDFLQGHPAVRGNGVAVVGFGTGGGLALWLATRRGDAVRAVVPFYGVAPTGAEPDWAALTAPVEGHYAEHDDFADQKAVAAFEEQLHDRGTEVRVFTYPGTGHAFFDDTRPETYDDEAARQAWVRTLEFLRAKLG